MNMTNNYIVDHLSVLMVKQEAGQVVDQAEYDDFWSEYEKIRKLKDVDGLIEPLFGGLIEINKLMYPIHDELMKKDISDSEFRFKTELLLRLNARRVELRSKVADLFGEPTEKKTYAPDVEHATITTTWIK